MQHFVKRVPLTFGQEHPLNITWPGHQNVAWEQGKPCPSCDATRLSPLARVMRQLWYGHDPQKTRVFISTQNGTLRSALDELWMLAYPNGNTHLNNAGWRRRPMPDDWMAVAKHHQIPESLLPRFIAAHQTLPLIDEDVLAIVQARCKGINQPFDCQTCEGQGRIWEDPTQKNRALTWTPEDPPIGEGWQAWETAPCSCAITPVFDFREDLTDWLTTVLHWTDRQTRILLQPDEDANTLGQIPPNLNDNVTIDAELVEPSLYDRNPTLESVTYAADGTPFEAVTKREDQKHTLWKFRFSRDHARLYRTPVRILETLPLAKPEPPHTTFATERLWRNSDESLSGCYWNSHLKSWLPKMRPDKNYALHLHWLLNHPDQTNSPD